MSELREDEENKENSSVSPMNSNDIIIQPLKNKIKKTSSKQTRVWELVLLSGLAQSVAGDKTNILQG